MLEYVPHIAFTGAVGLVAFVAGEAALRRIKAHRGPKTKVTPESVRGLAGRPEPLKVVAPVTEDARWAEAEETIRTNESPTYVATEDVFVQIGSARQSGIAMLHVSVEDSTESFEVPADSSRHEYTQDDLSVEEEDVIEPADELELVHEHVVLVDDLEPATPDEPSADEVFVRREDSVRVFDAVVAPSERRASAA